MDKNKIRIRFFGRKIGFTLTEILVVVIIIGVLATLALPMLVKAIEKAKVGEATSNLNLIRTGQKIYFLQYRTFTGSLSDLNIENPNSATSRYFEYTPSSAGDDLLSNFKAIAVRGGGDAPDAPTPYQGVVYYISKEGQITSSDGMFAPQE